METLPACPVEVVCDVFQNDVYVMQFVLGSSIALLAMTVVVLDFNIADLCYEKTFRWNSMPKMIQSIRVTGKAVEGFFIQLWHFLLCCVRLGI